MAATPVKMTFSDPQVMRVICMGTTAEVEAARAAVAGGGGDMAEAAGPESDARAKKLVAWLLPQVGPAAPLPRTAPYLKTLISQL